MIDKPKDDPGRKQLGFAEAVVREFEFVEASYGFRRIEESITFVRYESDQIFLNVYHGRSSYEIGVELGKLVADPSVNRYGLSYVIAGLAPEYEGQTSFQATEPKTIAKCVAKAARIVESYCGPALAGDREAFQKIEEAARVEGERLLVRYKYGAIINRADHAWENKDRVRAAELYEEAEPGLDTTRKRRLDYIRRKIR